MFLHIGGSRIIFHKDIIGIFNLNLRKNPVNKQFLETAPDTGFLEASEFEKNKTFIVTSDQVYLSPIAPITLARRKTARSLKVGI
ncbi:MAG: extracellular matrix regulator RemB [Bacillota bacterium]